MISFIDQYATAIIAGAVTVIALLGAKLYECQRRLNAAEAKAGDYDALNRRLTEAKSLYYQRERTVAMAQKELVESARKRKAAEAKAEKLLQDASSKRCKTRRRACPENWPTRTRLCRHKRPQSRSTRRL